MTPSETRREIVRQVEACVCRDRANTYGDAEDNFADIADIANILLAQKLAEPLSATDVAVIMCAVKLSRIKTSPAHADNWVDLAGYAVCGGGIEARKAAA